MGASVQLFASVMLLFWYVLRLVGQLRGLRRAGSRPNGGPPTRSTVAHAPPAPGAASRAAHRVAEGDDRGQGQLVGGAEQGLDLVLAADGMVVITPPSPSARAASSTFQANG